MFAKYFHIALFLLCGAFINAQNFSHEGELKGLRQTGYYKIPVAPEAKKQMRYDFRDVRLLDSADHEVPYYYLTEAPLKGKENYGAFKIISETHFQNCTELLIEGKANEEISNLAFKTSSPGSYTYCSVEGSSDSLHWLTVINSQLLNTIYSETYDSVYRCIYFPETKYLYYRVKLEGPETDSLKIMSAGNFKNSLLAGETFPLTFRSQFTEDTKKKLTVVKLTFENNQQIDRLTFRIRDTTAYKRHVTIYANKTERQKHKTLRYRDNLFEFDLSSDKSLLINVPAINEREIFIEIENKNLPPLQIESISCQQYAGYLICYLDSLNTYTLKCGNQKLRSPNYDPDFFDSSLPQLLPVLLFNLNEIPPPEPPATTAALPFLQTKTFLCLCLLLGAASIIFFSVFLLKDMGKKIH